MDHIAARTVFCAFACLAAIGGAGRAAGQAAPSPHPGLDLEHGLIVGHAKALVLWAPDGSAQRVLSAGPALHPVRTDSGSLLVLNGKDGNLNLGAQLVRISLQDGTRTRVAKLPAFACANASSASEDDDGSSALGLDVQAADDFEVDASGKVACLTLMDRNANMADLQLKVRVELDSGRVQRWLTVGEDDCKAPKGVIAGEPDRAHWCNPRMEPEPEPEPATRFAFDYDVDTGWVRRVFAKPENHVHLNEYLLEQTSPSGRWLVLGGDHTDGDYIHRSLVLCDREDGAIYPVLAKASAWPVPLKAAKRGGMARIRVPSKGMADVVGESDVLWLGGPTTEMLIVDQLVIRPNARSWTFKGQLAH